MPKNLNSFIGLILLAWLFVNFGSAAEAKNYQKKIPTSQRAVLLYREKTP